MVDSTNGMVTTSTSDHNEGSASRLDVRAGPNVLIVGGFHLARPWPSLAAKRQRAL
jgi:hypothetical protein